MVSSRRLGIVILIGPVFVMLSCVHPFGAIVSISREHTYAMSRPWHVKHKQWRHYGDVGVVRCNRCGENVKHNSVSYKVTRTEYEKLDNQDGCKFK
jgi:hypothetical protein